MYILGINAFHGDSSACIVKDGKLVVAIEEERIRRVKHWAGFPSEAIKFCLNEINIEIQDIDHVAISRNPSAHLGKKILRIVKKTPKLSFLKDRVKNVQQIGDVKIKLAKLANIEKDKLRCKIHNIEHHKAHLASSFLVSPYEEAALVSVDGFGDFLSTMIGRGKGKEIKIYDRVEYPHSLGIFYTAMTQYLGFWKYGDEYKIMGLAAYGKPEYIDQMRQIVKIKDNGLFELDTSFFKHDSEGVDMVWDDGYPNMGQIYSEKIVDMFGRSREYEEELTEKYINIATSVQKRYEEAFFSILNKVQRKTKSKNLCLSGGCAQNSLANGKIYSNTNFEKIYIPSAAHDAGTAVGAAYVVWNDYLNNDRSFVMDSPFWGYSATSKKIEESLEKEGLKYELMEDNELIERVTDEIFDKKVLGWFQGKTEWGPRALGNRSIIVDPRDENMKDILNARIKKREWFRPFAPSILEEHTNEWFEQNEPTPFMEKVYRLRTEKRHLVPAVAHKDGTGRLQTVSKKINPKYYNLIESFYKKTDVPMILNTSFNENEPIVNTPKEAIDCFLRTKMDVLVLENYFIKK
ncbi:MAG: carbamoyltransferase [Kosmotoga sp.]|nr:MAG: carbamoyltransferase [Kosmotoga sp.]